MAYRLAIALLIVCGAHGSVAQSFNVTHFAGPPAGPGRSDGTGVNARFAKPFDAAADASGNIYVADLGNYTIRKITSAGQVTTFAGLAGQAGFVNGTGSTARFTAPQAVTIDAAGNLYVADGFPASAIRKISPAGVVSTFAQRAPTTDFNDPYDLAVDSAGNVYFLDNSDDRISIISPSGTLSRLSPGLGGLGAIAVDTQGAIYVSAGYAIQRISSSGMATILAGSASTAGSTDGAGTAARFQYNALGLATDTAGNVFVSDSLNNTIRRVTPGGVVTTLAGLAGTAGDLDGTGSAARLSYPAGVAVSGSAVFVCDTRNFAVRRVAADSTVTTLAGGPGGFNAAGTRDGTGSAAASRDL